MTTEDDVKVYNADEVTCMFANQLINSGLADGEFITIEQEEDDTTDVTGTDGEVCVSRNNKRITTVMLKLLQSSDSNDFLSSLRTAALAAPGLAGIAPLYIRDRNGRALYEGRAWIAAPPKDVSFDRGAKGRSWKLRFLPRVRVDGGNVRAGVG